MSLPRHYRFVVRNETGVVISIGDATITARRWNFNSSGAKVWEAAEATVFSNAGSIANNDEEAGSVIDDTTDLFLGGYFVFTGVTTGTPDGNLTAYLQVSNDGGTTWQTSVVLSDLVGSFYFDAASTQRTFFRL